jgi:hypothetical protein
MVDRLLLPFVLEFLDVHCLAGEAGLWGECWSVPSLLFMWCFSKVTLKI